MGVTTPLRGVVTPTGGVDNPLRGLSTPPNRILVLPIGPSVLLEVLISYHTTPNDPPQGRGRAACLPVPGAEPPH